MYKILILALVICAANAGVIGGIGGLGGLGLGHGIAVAPVAVAHAPLATSYQNNNQISLHPTAVVATKTIAAPVAVAHAPVAVGIGLGGVGLGGVGLGGVGLGGLGLGGGLLH